MDERAERAKREGGRPPREEGGRPEIGRDRPRRAAGARAGASVCVPAAAGVAFSACSVAFGDQAPTPADSRCARDWPLVTHAAITADGYPRSDLSE